MASDETNQTSGTRNVTDEQCRVNPDGGARYCKQCRDVIYIGSRLPEDRYTTVGGDYYHTACQ